MLIVIGLLNVTTAFTQTHKPIDASGFLKRGGNAIKIETTNQLSALLKSTYYNDECVLYFENAALLKPKIIKILNNNPRCNLYINGAIDSNLIFNLNRIGVIQSLHINAQPANCPNLPILNNLTTVEKLYLDATEPPQNTNFSPTILLQSIAVEGAYGHQLFEQIFNSQSTFETRNIEINFIPQTELKQFTKLETVTINLANSNNADAEYYSRNLKNSETGAFLQVGLLTNDTISKTAFDSIFSVFKNYTEITETTDQNSESTNATINPYIKPPIKGLETPFERFEIQASQGLTELVTKSGTKITLPSNALIDTNGKPYNGAYTLLYREYKNGMDAFLSGIPMVYANNGDTNMFETNGMFEVQAVANGQILSLKENATLNIEMEGAKADTGFDFFELDTTGNWKKIAPSSSINPISKAQNNTQVIRQIGRYYLIDTLSFESKYRSLKHSVYEDRLPAFSDQITYRFFHLNYYESPNRKGRTGYKHHPRTRNFRIRLLPKRQRDDQELRIQLAIDLNAVKIFKEYKAFNNTVWVLKENCGRQLFKERYKQNKIYKDFRILYNTDDNSCVLELKTLQGFIQLEVDLAQTLAQNKMSLRRFENHYNRYQRILNKKRDRYNKTVKRRKKNPFIYRYIQLDTLNPNSINLAPNQFLYSIVVSRFGIYNCDRIRILESRIAVKPQLLDSSNLRIHPEMYYVFYPELNMVYSLTQNSFYIDPNAAMYIMVIDQQSNMWCYTRNQIKNTLWSVGATVPLMLSRFNQNIHTVGDLMTIINSKNE